MKALHLYYKQEAWGHVVAQLLAELPKNIDIQPGLFDKSQILDNFYIPTRYPNGHPDGAPLEHYGILQSKQAIQYASEIIEFVRSKIA